MAQCRSHGCRRSVTFQIICGCRFGSYLVIFAGFLVRFSLSSTSPLLYFDPRSVLVAASLLALPSPNHGREPSSLISSRFAHLWLRLLPNGKGFEGWGGTGDVALARSAVERLGFCLMALVSFCGSGWVVLIVGCFLQFG